MHNNAHVKPYSRMNPSPRYVELTAMYKQMHIEGESFHNIAPKDTFPGKSLFPQAPRIKRLIDITKAKSILDYGCGKGVQYEPCRIETPEGAVFDSIPHFWGVESVTRYDPCYEPFSTLPRGIYDGVVCTDVLEHCPEDDINWILEEIFSYSRAFVFANVACYPAKKRLPNGENAHCTVNPSSWWVKKIDEIALLYPKISYEVWIQYPTGDQTNPLAEDRVSNI